MTRTGVTVSVPLIPQEDGRAQFVFCLAYADEANLRACSRPRGAPA
jgi:hypothetical protein